MKKKLIAINTFLFILGITASEAHSASFNIKELNFPNGAIVSGTITTNNKIGLLDESDFTNWNITVTSGTNTNPFTFTETNSSLFTINEVSSDGNNLTIPVPNGTFQLASNIGSPFGDSFIIPTYFLSLAEFNLFNPVSNNSALFTDRSIEMIPGISTRIDPLTISPSTYVFASRSVSEPFLNPLSILGIGITIASQTKLKHKLKQK